MATLNPTAPTLLLRGAYIVAAAVLCGVTLAANAHFGASLGTSPAEKVAYAGASVAADLIKISSVVMVMSLWRRRLFGLAMGAGLLGLCCLLWSIASASGFAFSSRDLAAAHHASSKVTIDGWQATIQRAGQQLALVDGSRPAGVVQAELATQMVADPIWRRTQGCSQLTIPESHDACRRVLELRQELAASKAAAALAEEMAQARRQLAMPPMVSTGDAQVAGLAGVLGFQEATVRHGLALMLVALVELGSALGLAVGAGAKPQPPATNASPPTSRCRPIDTTNVASAASRSKVVPFQPRASRRVQDRKSALRSEASFSQWWAEAARPDRGGCVGARSAYQAYCAWAKETGTAAMTETAFGRRATAAISNLGGKKVHRATGAFYSGIALISAHYTVGHSRTTYRE